MIEPEAENLLLGRRKTKENTFLNSLCELGFSLELGPIAPGTLKASILQKTENLVHHVLDYLDKYNRGFLPNTKTRVNYLPALKKH